MDRTESVELTESEFITGVSHREYGQIVFEVNEIYKRFIDEGVVVGDEEYKVVEFEFLGLGLGNYWVGMDIFRII